MNHARVRRMTSLVMLGAVLLVTALSSLPAHGQQASILADVVKRGVLRVATVAGNPPYSALGSDGKPIGYDIDIANLIASTLKVKTEFIITDSPGRIVVLQTRRADMTVANFTNTVERSTVIAFTEPYVVVGSIFMVLKSAPLQTVEQLNDAKYKIGYPRGGTAEQIAAAAAPKATKVRFDTVGDAFLALKSGQVNAQLMDSFQNSTWIAKEPALLRNLPGNWSYEEICIGLPAGDFDWWRVLNTWVKQFNASGENAQLFKKHFGFELPKIQQEF
jgi:polar amino acid transport system substrate-binding protein